MKITTLVENHADSARPALQEEHGLSFYIENMGHVFMSDVGGSGKFADNAAVLGVDLTRVEALAISHHHYDHGGGLGRFLQENDLATVYLRQSPDVDYVGYDPSQPIKNIGLDKALLAKYGRRIVMIAETSQVRLGFHLITHIPKVYSKPSGDQRLKIKRGDDMKPDTFEHEMVTVVEGADGLVVLTGCAHNGVLNMVEATRQALPGKSIQALVGGFHLRRENIATVRSIGEQLLATGIPAIYTGHCTGEEATDALEEVLGERLHRLYTGLEMAF